jgi:hypothetical protein
LEVISPRASRDLAFQPPLPAAAGGLGGPAHLRLHFGLTHAGHQLGHASLAILQLAAVLSTLEGDLVPGHAVLHEAEPP